MAYLAPTEFVTKLIDAGESKIFMSTRDTLLRAYMAGAILALVGVVNIPIIYFSVKWWNTLHQGASVSLTKAPTMATQMLTGMLIMTIAFWAYSFALSFYRCRTLILERERHTAWAQETVK